MNVVVGIDGTEQQRDALALGSQLAAVDGGGMTIAHAYPWSDGAIRLGTAYAKTVEDDAAALLATAAESVTDVPVDVRAIADPSAPRALHRLAAEEQADAIVIGSCHRGPIGHTLLGGTGDRVLGAAPCAVAVAPRGYGDGRHAMRRIGVAYDGSAEATEALGWASRFAQAVDATVTVFSVVEPPVVAAGFMGPAPGDYAELERSAQEACRQSLDEAVAALPPDVDPEPVMLHGAAARTLAGAAADVDLLVMGSRGYGPVRTTLLGSVSHALIRKSPRPVIVLPRGSGEAPRQTAAVNAAAGAGA